jgi:hypothetical protein
MAKAFTTDDLMSQVRLVENLPDGAQVFSDADILQFMNDALFAKVIPLILQCREDYLTVTQDFTLGTGANTIEIPNEAMGYRLRDVYYVDSSGGFHNLPRFTPSQAASFGLGGLTGGFAGVAGFYIQGNTLEIFPASAGSGQTFRLLFHKRPAELVSLADCGKIIAINIDNGLLSLDNIPTTWDEDTIIDIIDPVPPFNYPNKVFANNPTYATPQKLINETFASAPSGNLVFVDPIFADQLSNNQYVCESGTAPFVQYLPTDVYPLLKRATANACLIALGEPEAIQTGLNEYKDMAQNLVNGLATPRVEGKPKKIIANRSIGREVRTRGGRL